MANRGTERLRECEAEAPPRVCARFRRVGGLSFFLRLVPLPLRQLGEGGLPHPKEVSEGRVAQELLPLVGVDPQRPPPLALQHIQRVGRPVLVLLVRGRVVHPLRVRRRHCQPLLQRPVGHLLHHPQLPEPRRARPRVLLRQVHRPVRLPLQQPRPPRVRHRARHRLLQQRLGLPVPLLQPLLQRHRLLLLRRLLRRGPAPPLHLVLLWRSRCAESRGRSRRRQHRSDRGGRRSAGIERGSGRGRVVGARAIAIAGGERPGRPGRRRRVPPLTLGDGLELGELLDEASLALAEGGGPHDLARRAGAWAGGGGARAEGLGLLLLPDLAGPPHPREAEGRRLLPRQLRGLPLPRRPLLPHVPLLHPLGRLLSRPGLPPPADRQAGVRKERRSGHPPSRGEMKHVRRQINGVGDERVHPHHLVASSPAQASPPADRPAGVRKEGRSVWVTPSGHLPSRGGETKQEQADGWGWWGSGVSPEPWSRLGTRPTSPIIPKSPPDHT